MRSLRSNRQQEKSRDSLKIGEYAVRTMALSISLQMLLSALLTTVSVTGSFSGASRPVKDHSVRHPGQAHDQAAVGADLHLALRRHESGGIHLVDDRGA